MFYYKRIEDGALCAGSAPPFKIDKFIEITQEEYEEAIAKLLEEEEGEEVVLPE